MTAVERAKLMFEYRLADVTRHPTEGQLNDVANLIQAAIDEEKERCAKVVESFYGNGAERMLDAIAAKILETPWRSVEYR